MHVYSDIREIDYKTFDRPMVSLGTFDGVHLGHQAIIKRLLQKAKEKNKTSLVVTYEPHPQSVVAPQTAPKILTTLEEKLYLFEKLGVEKILVINFDSKLSQFKAEDFIEEILVRKLNVGGIVVGHDHAFGRNRSGKIELLSHASKRHDFDLEVLPAVYADDSTDESLQGKYVPVRQERISSTKIRKVFLEGDFNQGIKMLGHTYPIWGEVTKGKGRGKTLDYPTINLTTPSAKLLPKDGVYSSEVQIQNKNYLGMLHLGAKPTFGDNSHSIEVHLFDVGINQIDPKVYLFVESWIRESRKFDTPTLLKDQLKADEKMIKQMFHMR